MLAVTHWERGTGACRVDTRRLSPGRGLGSKRGVTTANVRRAPCGDGTNNPEYAGPAFNQSQSVPDRSPNFCYNEVDCLQDT
jgi:hypothetical protein